MSINLQKSNYYINKFFSAEKNPIIDSYIDYITFDFLFESKRSKPVVCQDFNVIIHLDFEEWLKRNLKCLRKIVSEKLRPENYFLRLIRKMGARKKIKKNQNQKKLKLSREDLEKNVKGCRALTFFL